MGGGEVPVVYNNVCQSLMFFCLVYTDHTKTVAIFQMIGSRALLTSVFFFVAFFVVPRHNLRFRGVYGDIRIHHRSSYKHGSQMQTRRPSQISARN